MSDDRAAYERMQRSIDKQAERLKQSGAAKTSEEARRRAEKTARELERKKRDQR